MRSMTLKEWAEHRGFAQADLAAALEISPPMLSKLMKRSRWPSSPLAYRIEILTSGRVRLKDLLAGHPALLSVEIRPVRKAKRKT